MNFSAFPGSLYAAELQRGFPDLRFCPQLEAEYARAHLAHSRTLIRVTCLLATLLASFRGIEQLITSSWNTTSLVNFGFVIPISMWLTWLAWSRRFEGEFLSWARVVVPIRNSIIAIAIAEVATRGHLEMFMILPALLIGPFFFLGLRFRSALLSGVLTTLSFIAATVFFELALPLALRSGVFLSMSLIVCALCARHLERWSRTSFLETHLIAELAQHDALTGTKNRRVFDEHLERLWSQTIAADQTMAVLLIDIDHFKEYNDRYGHQAGDQTLHRVAQAAQRFVQRPLDLLARYGGEEFVAVLYDVDGPKAAQIAEQIRRAVEGLGVEHRGSRTAASVTISIGVAVVSPSRERNSRGALQLADQALYEAKVRGRNRVEVMNEAEHEMLVTGIFKKGAVRAVNR